MNSFLKLPPPLHLLLSGVIFLAGNLLITCSAYSQSNLDSINFNDQRYRNQLDEVRRNSGGDSKELRLLFEKMKEADSINLLKVSEIIAKFGWLKAENGRILFMVIQHSDLDTQKKYLPIVRKAVSDGILKPGNLALLEDRIALREGRKQIYGSQISWNLKTNQYFVLPLADPDQVDQRRAAVGLKPLAAYIKDCCGLLWSLEEYKRLNP